MNKCIIRMGQVNLQNSKRATAHARKLMEDKGLDFLLVQEPYSKNGKIVGMGVSNNIIGNRTDGERVYAAIVSTNNFSPLILHQYNTTHFAVAQVNLGNKEVYMISAYYQFGHQIEEYIDHTTAILSDLRGKKVIFAADINAKSRTWYNDSADVRGNHVESMIMNLNLEIMNRNCTLSTHTSGSNIDITLITTALVGCLRDWNVEDEETLSDHRLITFKVKTETETILCTGYTIKDANYEAINSRIVELLQASPPPDNSYAKAELYQRIVERTCADKLKQRKTLKKSVPWWSRELTLHKQKTNKARKKAQRCCPCQIKQNYVENYKRTRREFKRLIKKAKQDSWEKFAATNFNEDPYGFVYKLGTGRLKRRDLFQSVRRDDGLLTVSLGDTIDVLIDRLLPGDSQVNEQVIHAALRNRVEQWDLEGEDPPPFTMEELETALKSAKAKKCPGPDNVPMDVIKMFDENNKAVLLSVLDDLWQDGIFPDFWKIAKLTIIRKQGNRDWSNPKSYRPISLLPVIGKTYERLIAGKMDVFMEERNLLNPQQHGFRKGKSTLTAIRALNDEIDNATTKHVVAVFLDIAGAFDGVWWPAVINRLIDINLPSYLIKIMKSYLYERKQIIRHEQCNREISASKGCPQGSVLGPKLWNIVLDELLEAELPNGSKLIAYADDLVLVIKENSRKGIEESFQNCWVHLTAWANKVKLSFAPTKTAAIHFKGRLPGRAPLLRVGDELIAFKDKFNYLGLTMDRSRLYVEHVKNASAKAKKIMAQVTRMARLRYGVRSQAYQKIYSTVFVPILSYGLEIWHHRLGKVLTKKILRAAQGQVLRQITGAYRTVSFEAVTVLSGFPPIDLALEERQQNRYRKLGRTQLTRTEIARAVDEKWQREWTETTKGRVTFGLIPEVKRHKDLTVKVDHLTMQILTEHGATRSYLHRFGKFPTPECAFCRNGVTEDIKHLTLSCPKYQLSEYRLDLVEWATTNSIPWPPQVAQIMNDKDAFLALRSLVKEIASDNRGITRNLQQ